MIAHNRASIECSCVVSSVSLRLTHTKRRHIVTQPSFRRPTWTMVGLGDPVKTGPRRHGVPRTDLGRKALTQTLLVWVTLITMTGIPSL